MIATKPIRIFAVAGIATLALGSLVSCGPLVSLGGDKKPPTLYSLAAPSVPADSTPFNASILVEEPTSSDALDGRRIALKPSALEFQYYEGARWTDSAPRMVQGLLMAGFTGLVSDVGSTAMPVKPDYRLQTRLIDFQSNYPTPGNPVATVTLEVKLFSTSPMTLIGSTTLKAEETAGADRMAAISQAFNQATQTVIGNAVTWTTDTIKARTTTTQTTP